MKTLFIASSRVQATISTVYTRKSEQKTRGNKRIYITLQIITDTGPVGVSCFTKPKLAKELVKRAFEKNWLMLNLDGEFGQEMRKNINIDALKRPLKTLMRLI